MASSNSLQKRTTLTVYQRSVVTAVIVLIYLVACCCPALTFDNYYAGNSAPQSTETWFGWTALLRGWLGILVGSVAWLANFVLGLTLVFLMCGLRWATLISSAVTVLLKHGLFPYFLSQYSGRRRRCWASGLTTTWNRCVALVCQYRRRVRWNLDPISGAKDLFTSSCACTKRTCSMSKKRFVQSA